MERQFILPVIVALLKHRQIVLELLEDSSFNQNRLHHECILKLTNNVIPKIENYVTGVVQYFNHQTFRQHFRVNVDTFNLMMQTLTPYWEQELQHSQVQYGGNEQISLEKTLLIALWIFATPDSYRSVGERFNVSKSTVYKSIKIIISLINLYLCPQFTTWPSIEEREVLSTSFEMKNGFPQVIGCIDGCHIPIRRPLDNGNDYYNRKKFYSVILQGICKSNLAFIDVDCRWPGSVHDARVLRTSPVYHQLENLCAPNYFILGDAAYPCHPNLMPPFKNNGHLTRPQLHFNNMLSKTRVCIEHAFALLKGRFRRLKYLEMYDLEDIVTFVICCTILHNLFLAAEDDIQQFLEEGLNDIHLIHYEEDFQGNNNQDGNPLRNELVNYLWNIRQR